MFDRKQTWTSPQGEYYNLYADMLQQPHLLIAGATGSGKSVVINALMYTALYKKPDEISFIFIDPKRVELSVYCTLPQCLKYSSEPDDIRDALQYALQIVETRYREMQREGQREYQGGHVYVIIDELADLMTTDRRHVQPLLQRLCQIGRAARVHVIAATQCPLAVVIPTPIKVNFDAKLGLRCSTKQDSRNILGATGCEALPRYGQGFYKTPDGITLYNLPMYTDTQLADRVRWWTDQTRPQRRRWFA